MLQNYLKIAYRNLLRYKGYSLINIVGLAVGLACCIVIVLFDAYELGFDRFYPNADRIVRVSLRGRVNDSDLNMAVSCGPLAPTVAHELPEVEAATRITIGGFPVLRYKDRVFSEERFYRADSSFFSVFPQRFLKGDPSTALLAPQSVVITESMARKYFGDEDPMGKPLNMDRRVDWQVTGVIEDMPAQSHFHCDFIARLVTNDPNWLSNNYYTYLLLREDTDLPQFERNMAGVVKSRVGPQVEAALGVSFDKMIESGARYGYVVEPMTSIHLRSHLDHEIEANGDISYIYVFSGIAISILLIACVNFMNLATARSERRAREIGIRKTLGSYRWQLIQQFSLEAILMAGVSVVLAVSLVQILLPSFRELTGRNIDLPILSSFWTVPLLLLFAVVVGLLAGSYPAFYLSSVRPISSLKADTSGNRTTSRFRSVLVVFQFMVSIVLVIGTIVVAGQMRFLQSKKLGFDKDQIIIVDKVDDIGNSMGPFTSRLLAVPGIVNVTNSTAIPGRRFSDQAFSVEGAGGEEVQDLITLTCDLEFAATFGLQMQSGRFFSREHPSDSLAVVINETAARVLRLDDPVGRRLVDFATPDGRPVLHEIIGVVNDFNFESLHREVRPLVISMFRSGGFGRVLSVKVAGGTYEKTIRSIESAWHTYAGQQAFEYSFFDENLSRMYANEQRTGQIVSVFTALAILIACLGLFGLAAFVAEKRTKEIGIRKVLGASTTGIVGLITREFVVLVVLANLLAWPLSYWIATRWLQEFAYRIDIDIWIFAAAGLLALLVAFATVSFQAIKAALTNPVEALKYE